MNTYQALFLEGRGTCQMDKWQDGWADKQVEARHQEVRLGRIPMGGDGKAALWWKALKLLSSSAWGLELYKSKMSRRHWSCLALLNKTQTQRQSRTLSPRRPWSAPASNPSPRFSATSALPLHTDTFAGLLAVSQLVTALFRLLFLIGLRSNILPFRHCVSGLITAAGSCHFSI